MDTMVSGIGAVVVAELRAAGYMESTVGQYAKAIKALTEFSSGREYSTSLGAEFASMTTSVRTGRFSRQRRFDYRRLVAVFDSYVQTGRVDLAVRGRGGGGPRPEGSDFVALDAAWEAEMGRRGLAPATREAYGRVARSYLVFLEGRGIAVLDGADGASVLAFLESLLDRWAKSSLFWVVSNFRPFLKFTGRTDLVNALNLAGIKRFHAIVPVLEDADEELVVRACASGVVSARDAAITLLALSTGLRACDIVALRMGDVDWRGHTIDLVQQKTGNPLTLPLPALLLSKLASYVLDERPSSADDHLFLRSVAPHTRLNDHATVHRVTVETFRKAGVNQPKAGTRLLRHNAASRLLAAAVPLPTIAAVLGHANEESTNLYMSVDRLRLLDCVLPVPEAVRSLSGHGFCSAFATELDAYLAFKASMGFTGASRIWYLKQFDSYCAEHDRTVFDKDTVEGWVGVQLQRSGRYRSWMSYIRDVARWMTMNGIPGAYVLSDRWKAPVVAAHPYLLSRHDIELFFAAAARMQTPCPWRWQAVAFFTLMHSCALRTGETRALQTGQVDLDAGHIDIIWSKGHRSRRLPLTDQVIEILDTCDRTSRAHFASRRTFFVSATGNQVSAATVGKIFGRIWDQAGLPRPVAGQQPRPYDFRHHFAYANIHRWMTAGDDVAAMLPYLSRYMGHATFDSTYYYVHTSPDFMATYADITRQRQSLLPQVGF